MRRVPPGAILDTPRAGGAGLGPREAAEAAWQSALCPLDPLGDTTEKGLYVDLYEAAARVK